MNKKIYPKLYLDQTGIHRIQYSPQSSNLHLCNHLEKEKKAHVIFLRREIIGIYGQTKKRPCK